MSTRYEIRFLPEAAKEYKKLDGSVKKFVTIALRKLEDRAHELGENLYDKKETKLNGCRKIKFRSIGIRIIYRIIDDQTEIVEIITIGKREDYEVYETAHNRLEKLKTK